MGRIQWSLASHRHPLGGFESPPLPQSTETGAYLLSHTTHRQRKTVYAFHSTATMINETHLSPPGWRQRDRASRWLHLLIIMGLVLGFACDPQDTFPAWSAVALTLTPLCLFKVACARSRLIFSLKVPSLQ